MKVFRATRFGIMILTIGAIIVSLLAIIGWVGWQIIAGVWASPEAAIRLGGAMAIFMAVGVSVIMVFAYIIGRLVLFIPAVDKWEKEEQERYRQ